MLSGLDEAQREAAWTEIEHELRKFEGPCELVVGSGTK